MSLLSQTRTRRPDFNPGHKTFRIDRAVAITVPAALFLLIGGWAFSGTYFSPDYSPAEIHQMTQNLASYTFEATIGH